MDHMAKVRCSVVYLLPWRWYGLLDHGAHLVGAIPCNSYR